MSRRWLCLLPLLLAVVLAGCETPRVPLVEKEKGEEEAPIRGKEEVLAKLPCFNCHLIRDYLAEPQPGVFSHEFHYPFGVHCPQCHEARGHAEPRIIASVCGGCHNLGRLLYEGGGVGEVVFDHGFHGTAFACGDCHPGEFPMKKGLAPMTMEEMYQGRFCGSCHDGRTAFSSEECMKCHRG